MIIISVTTIRRPYLLHSEQSDNVAVVELPQNLKLSHLDFIGAVVAHHVKHLHSHKLTGLLLTQAQCLHLHTGHGKITEVRQQQPTPLQPQQCVSYHTSRCSQQDGRNTSEDGSSDVVEKASSLLLPCCVPCRHWQ